MMLILFVCTGNTCRSPMCEVYFNHLTRQAGCDDLEASSAGIYAGGGAAMSDQATKVMAELGLETQEWRNRQLTQEVLAAADLIVVMGASHEQWIAKMNPDARHKVRWLMEYADQGKIDVSDPFGGTVEVYRRCFKNMKTALDNLFLELKSRKQ